MHMQQWSCSYHSACGVSNKQSLVRHQFIPGLDWTGELKCVLIRGSSFALVPNGALLVGGWSIKALHGVCSAHSLGFRHDMCTMVSVTGQREWNGREFQREIEGIKILGHLEQLKGILLKEQILNHLNSFNLNF